MLRMHLYAIFTRPITGMDEVRACLDDHLAYQFSIEEQGIMVAAGPLLEQDDDTWNGEGMIIVRANSLDEARGIAEADPMHSRGIRAFDLRPWVMNEGSLSVKIRFSQQSAEIT